MKVRNNKNKTVPLNFPIGVKSRLAISETKMVKPGEVVELSDEDGKKLISIDRQLDLPEEKRTRKDPAIWTWFEENEQIPQPQSVNPVPWQAEQAQVTPERENDVAQDPNETVEMAADEEAHDEEKKGRGGKKKKG